MKKAITLFVLALVLMSITFCGISVKNQDSYKTIKIGNQVWMTENINVSTYRNGDPIPEIKTVEEWIKYGNEGKGCWCYYNNDTANGSKYGKLYNWYAVNDSRNIAPTGFHVATKAEWITMIIYLGGELVAGGKLKEAGTNHWNSPNTGATNESGFTSLPGGLRSQDGTFKGIGNVCYWWCSNEHSANLAYCCDLGFKYSYGLNGVYEKMVGFSVRCIKD